MSGAPTHQFILGGTAKDHAQAFTGNVYGNVYYGDSSHRTRAEPNIETARRDTYTVGWVSALPIELSAAQAMLDEPHEDLPTVGSDDNSYALGRIGKHNVVLACLPYGEPGTSPAMRVAMQMMTTFPRIRFVLMVGVGGGVPSEEADVRLGDVVVSLPRHGHGGVVQYDFGKKIPGRFERTGFLNKPPQSLLGAVSKLVAKYNLEQGELSMHATRLDKYPLFRRDKAGPDDLFRADYQHVRGGTCADCDPQQRVRRSVRDSNSPVVHYGTIASGNQVMRDGEERDRISAEFGGILCFEMEAAGLMNSFPCLAIRGICDYADDHKNKAWQPYAAGMAAAYAKELLLLIPPTEVTQSLTVGETLKAQMRSFYTPFDENRQFVGRSVELETLERKLFIDQDCQTMAISGLGGIGKTQLARAFVFLVKSKHPEFSIFWVQALSMQTFAQGYAEVARALGISTADNSQEDCTREVQRALSGRGSGRWLLVVDNTDDLNVLCDIQDCLPQSELGLTIYTTRFGHVAQQIAGSNVIELGKMTQPETLNLLEKALLRKISTAEQETAGSLLEELHFLPLAITQAAAYINVHKSSLSDYLHLLRRSEKDAADLMAIDLGDRTRQGDLTNAVAKTWTLTFNALHQQNRHAAYLLAFMSCIEWKAIPLSILPEAPSKIQQGVAVGMLCSYSFLEKQDSHDMLNMHRLVHLAMRCWNAQRGESKSIIDAAIDHLEQVFPNPYYSNRKLRQLYLPHVTKICEASPVQALNTAWLLHVKVGQSLFHDGRGKDSVVWLERLWAPAQEMAEDDFFRLRIEASLAQAYCMTMQVEKAVPLLEHAALLIQRLQPDTTWSRFAQRELALAYCMVRKSEEGIEVLQGLVDSLHRTRAEDDDELLRTRRCLGVAYIHTGHFLRAVATLEHVVLILRRTSPENSLDTLSSQCLLAEAFREAGSPGKAIEIWQYILPKLSNVYGEEQPMILTAQCSFGRSLEDTGQVQRAIEIYEHVIRVSARTAGLDPSFLEQIRANLVQAQNTLCMVPELNRTL